MMKCLKAGCPFNTDDQILATSSQADKLAVLARFIPNECRSCVDQVHAESQSSVVTGR